MFKALSDATQYCLEQLRIHREMRALAPYFDADHYHRAYPDVAARGHQALKHYVRYGWKEGRDPTPYFSTRTYLKQNTHIARDGINPFLHFLNSSRDTRTSRTIKLSDVTDDIQDDVLTVVSEHLDPEYYLATYGDLPADTDAVRHYCQMGWRLGYDPNAAFSTSYYLSSYPDIADSGLNPFWHYLVAGAAEGRLPKHPGGWKYEAISHLQSLDTISAEWTRPEPAPKAMTKAAVTRKLKKLLGAKPEPVLVSISHDDYLRHPGGVQLCMQLEAEAVQAEGGRYLHIHPWQALPKLAAADANPLMELSVDGETVGAALMSDVIKVFADSDTALWNTVIHHVIGMALEQIGDMLDAMGHKDCKFWMHDYITVCPSFALQRNGLSRCDGPAPSSHACMVCLYGQERHSQLARFHAFFDRFDVDVIAPSEAALTFWKEVSDLRAASVEVLPHMTLTAMKQVGVKRTPARNPVRIGFVGTRAAHKGWPVFQELLRKHGRNDAMSFWYFGSDAPSEARLNCVQVTSSLQDPDAVTQSMAEHEIDIVLHWAEWHETFSLTTFEAMMAGAAVVTNTASGNVAAAVRTYDRGVVLPDLAALNALFDGDALDELAQSVRLKRSKTKLQPARSSLTAELLKQEAAA